MTMTKRGNTELEQPRTDDTVASLSPIVACGGCGPPSYYRRAGDWRVASHITQPQPITRLTCEKTVLSPHAKQAVQYLSKASKLSFCSS
ncbi:hypothetical protein J6590_006952 [Homalodisca vitripennis]|nr:hypothetical protein J6590_006952 [Homalodisca vitripennis]